MKPFTLRARTSGLLLHPTSLPSPHGIGDLGPEAYNFTEFLYGSGQTWWQMFPLGPPGMSNSPYQSLSAFAFNPLLISLERLVSDGLLNSKEIKPDKPFSKNRINFEKVVAFKTPLFRRAFENFERSAARRRELARFLEAEREWVHDYALFCAIKDARHGAAWDKWPEPLRRRERRALAEAERQLTGEVRYHAFLQYQFHKQWAALKAHCRAKGVGLIGDVPIFVAHDSVDVWAHPDQFWLEKDGQPIYIAGTPPDYFSKTGQRWGNPLYRWDRMRQDDYGWWSRRFKQVFKIFDAARLDHFIGFQRYWRIPVGDDTAKNGRWAPGPRSHFFDRIIKRLGPLEVIAEDLGVVTPEVKALRERFDFPGMRVLQFAFGNDPEAENYLPHSYPRRSVVYTGTHDNDTTVGWFNDKGSEFSTRTREQIRQEREFTLLYCGSNGREIHWDMIRVALMSVADTAIIPVQDVLGLGSEARMNLPGSVNNNWLWRLKQGALTYQTARRLYRLTHAYGRNSSKRKTEDHR